MGTEHIIPIVNRFKRLQIPQFGIEENKVIDLLTINLLRH